MTFQICDQLRPANRNMYLICNFYFMTRIAELSFDTLTVVASYLKVQEIVRLSETSREFQEIFQIKNLKFKRNHTIQNQENANIFYLGTSIENVLLFSGKTYCLQLLKFNMVTKDQGWVKDCQSGSWIEAEFSQQEPLEIQSKLDKPQKEPERIHLVHNYEVREYQKKRRILSKNEFPQGSSYLKIYLRSSGQNWKVSCEEIEVEKLYSQNITLTAKQLETFSLRKKTSQRNMKQPIKTRRRGLTSS